MPTVIQVNMHEAKSQLAQLAERKPGSLNGRIRIAPGFDAADAEIAAMFNVGVRRDAIDHLAKHPDEGRAK